MAKKRARYHFTDVEPFRVRTKEGEVLLGDGWLAITEAEYRELQSLYVTIERLKRTDVNKKLKKLKRELSDREDADRDAYLSQPLVD